MTDLAALHSDDAERSVLGGLLFRPALIGTLSIEVPDFYSPRHQAVFTAMRRLDADGMAIDPMTVSEELRRMGQAVAVGKGSEAGALGYVAELSLSCPSPENVEHYAKTLGKYAQKRAVVTALSEMLHQLKTSDMADGDDVLLEAIHRLQKLDTKTEDPSRALGDLMMDEIKAIQHDLDHDRGEWVGAMPTGLHKLDQNIGGIPLGVTTVILGDTGVGKTTLAMKLASAARTLANDRPIFVSYEDAFKSYARRGLAQESGVHTMKIGARRFGEGEAKRVIVDGMRAAGSRRERIIRFRGQPMADVCRQIRRLRARGPEAGAATIGKLCILDYWQAVKAPPGRREMSPVEAFAENARMIEDLADEEDIAIVIMSQVNDETEKRKGVPSLRDVAGGRDLVKGAKLVMGICRPSLYDPNADPTLGKLLILKNNAGETQRAIDVKLDLAVHSIHDTED